MNEENDLAIGDKVEVIDRGSHYFGQTGKVIKRVRKPLIMINSGKSGTLTLCEIKLEDTGAIEDFTVSQLRKIQ